MWELPLGEALHIIYTRNATFSEKHLDYSSQFLPLLLLGVHACGVVGAGMEQDDALLWDFLEEHKIRVIGWVRFKRSFIKRWWWRQLLSNRPGICWGKGWTEACKVCLAVTYWYIIHSTSKIKSTGLGVIVSVAFKLQSSVSEYWGVVPPRWFWKIDIATELVESLLWRKEESHNRLECDLTCPGHLGESLLAPKMSRKADKDVV